MELTIITPTYNRLGGVKKLYNSLKKQINLNFEWLVVDDGSTDGTDKFVGILEQESCFPVKYIYKKNGGKHTALNLGIKTINSELTFIVDSDDIITEDAVDTIIKYHEKYKNRKDICGYTFLREFPDGTINGKQFKTDQWITSYINARINSGDMLSDKAEVFRTNCLKECPFPEIPNEKFIGEDVVWIRLARKYNMVHINKAIYIGNYQDDGLTKNRRKNNIASPRGCMIRATELMKPDIEIKQRIKASLQYVIYGKFAGLNTNELINNGQEKSLIAISLIPGLLLYSKWKKDTKSLVKV